MLTKKDVEDALEEAIGIVTYEEVNMYQDHAVIETGEGNVFLFVERFLQELDGRKYGEVTISPDGNLMVWF